MKEEMEVLKQVLTDQRFYHLYGKSLSVALTATFSGDAVLKTLDDEKYFPKLIEPAPEIHLTREENRHVSHPAIADADTSLKEAVLENIFL